MERNKYLVCVKEMLYDKHRQKSCKKDKMNLFCISKKTIAFILSIIMLFMSLPLINSYADYDNFNDSQIESSKNNSNKKNNSDKEKSNNKDKDKNEKKDKDKKDMIEDDEDQDEDEDDIEHKNKEETFEEEKNDTGNVEMVKIRHAFEYYGRYYYISDDTETIKRRTDYQDYALDGYRYCGVKENKLINDSNELVDSEGEVILCYWAKMIDIHFVYLDENGERNEIKTPLLKQIINFNPELKNTKAEEIIKEFSNVTDSFIFNNSEYILNKATYTNVENWKHGSGELNRAEIDVEFIKNDIKDINDEVTHDKETSIVRTYFIYDRHFYDLNTGEYIFNNLEDHSIDVTVPIHTKVSDYEKFINKELANENMTINGVKVSDKRGIEIIKDDDLTDICYEAKLLKFTYVYQDESKEKIESNLKLNNEREIILREDKEIAVPSWYIDEELRTLDEGTDITKYNFLNSFKIEVNNIRYIMDKAILVSSIEGFNLTEAKHTNNNTRYDIKVIMKKDIDDENIDIDKDDNNENENKNEKPDSEIKEEKIIFDFDLPQGIRGLNSAIFRSKLQEYSKHIASTINKKDKDYAKNEDDNVSDNNEDNDREVLQFDSNDIYFLLIKRLEKNSNELDSDELNNNELNSIEKDSNGVYTLSNVIVISNYRKYILDINFKETILSFDKTILKTKNVKVLERQVINISKNLLRQKYGNIDYTSEEVIWNSFDLSGEFVKKYGDYSVKVKLLDKDNNVYETEGIISSRALSGSSLKNESIVLEDEDIPFSNADISNLASNRPTDIITRSEFASVINELVDAKNDNNIYFADIDLDKNKEKILALGSKGIVEGDGSNFFPDSQLTNEQACTILNRVLKFYGINSNLTENMNSIYASDLRYEKISDWAREGVAEMNIKGIYDEDVIITAKTGVTRQDIYNKLTKLMSLI